MSIGAGAIRAGLAVVELSADLGPLDAALQQAAGRLRGFSGRVARIGVGVAGIGLSIAGPIAAAFKGAVDQAGAMSTLATQLGTTAEEASRLTYALGTVGIGEEELVGFTRHLNNAFAAAADGSHEAVQGFARLGLNWQDLAKMPLVERVLAIRDALGKVTNGFDQSTQSAHYFGKRGMELLKLSAEELRKRMAEAGDVGAVVTKEQAAQAKEVQRAWGQIGSAIKFAFLEVGRALLPQADTVKKYAASVVNIARTVREWISANRPLVLGILGLGAALTAAGAALVALGVIGASVAGVLAGIAAVVGAVFSPVGLILIAVAGALAYVATTAYVLATQTEAGRASVRRLIPVLGEMAEEGRKAWGTIKEAALDAWGGIASALKRGDLQSAWEILVAGFAVVWEQVKASASAAWGTIRDKLLDAFGEATAALEMLFADVVGAIGAFFGRMLARVGSDLAKLLARFAALRYGGVAGILGKRLAAGAGEALENAGSGIAESLDAWREKRKQAARDELEAARKRRAEARLEGRDEGNDAVQQAKDRLKAILAEERKRAGADVRKGAPAEEGAGGPTLQQAAREVRGTFGTGITSSAGAQQALAVGSTPVQRQLVDLTKQGNGYLEVIAREAKGGFGGRIG